MCHAHAWPCLSTGWALNRHFGLTSGTAAVLAQGGGGGTARPPLLISDSIWQQSASRLKGGRGDPWPPSAGRSVRVRSTAPRLPSNRFVTLRPLHSDALCGGNRNCPPPPSPKAPGVWLQ